MEDGGRPRRHCPPFGTHVYESDLKTKTLDGFKNSVQIYSNQNYILHSSNEAPLVQMRIAIRVQGHPMHSNWIAECLIFEDEDEIDSSFTDLSIVEGEIRNDHVFFMVTLVPHTATSVTLRKRSGRKCAHGGAIDAQQTTKIVNE